MISTPVWSPDGSRIVWASNRDGDSNLYQKAASGAGEETLLLEVGLPQISHRLVAGRALHHLSPNRPKDEMGCVGLADDREWRGEAFPVVQTEANETAGTLSPDGRWLAYASDESGRYEVYVQSFPGGGGKRQVSTGGGNGPRWRRDGRELFYYAADGKLMAAQVRSGESFEAGAAVSLFEFRAGTLRSTFAPYAVTADGQRFLINAVVETEPNAPLTVVVNWAAGVKK